MHDQPPDQTVIRLEIERLTERIAVLEEDRARLMAYSRSPRHGKYDESRLNDRLRLELAQTSSGMLLETVEVEARCLRRCLAELEEKECTKPDTPALATWQEIDRRLNAGEHSIEETINATFASGLVRRVQGLDLSSVSTAYICEPSRDEALVPGPLFLIAFTGGTYGGPRIYRPVSDELRPDTGAFS